MRKEYSKVLRDSFTKLVLERLPQFRPEKVDSQYLWPGERAYLWIPKESIHLYIVLSPSLKGNDEFSVDICWSKLGRFPEIGARAAGTPATDHHEFEEDEFAFRITSLWPASEEFWKFYDEQLLMNDPVQLLMIQAEQITKEQAESKVLPQVQDAVDKLIMYGLPYFEAFLQRQF